MSPLLHEAIENLYMAFGNVSKPEGIYGCPCCIEAKRVDVLLSKPRRAITPDELSRYAASAFTTVGAQEDYLYFLPRILEVLANDLNWYPCPEVVSRKFAYADFGNWSHAHRAAVFRYFDRVFEDLVDAGEDGIDIDSWVCALGNVHSDIRPFLTRIAARPHALIKFYEQNSEALVTGGLVNSFWEPDHPAYRQVLAWFESPEIKKKIKDSYGL